ncbi:MAG: rod shape-determining protein RodA [Herpetosiphonaceae bacterium]|nr:rod shape-determining protein RodA [Herpetosiphonaceae bacterium]
MHARRWHDFNVYLALGVVVLLGFGLMLVWSTTVGQQAESYHMFINHLKFLAVGLVGLVALTIFDYHNFRPLAKPIYLFALLLLALVTTLGTVRDGARTELFGFQPSEPAKLMLIIALASWWSARAEQRQANSWVTLGGSLALAGVPLVMVLLQPDLGTAMVMGCIWLAMAWSAGMRWFHLLALVVVAIPVGLFGWQHVLKTYQQARLVAFNYTQEQVDHIPDPESKKYVQSVLYQTGHAVIAIGHGGLWGQGLNNGSQSQRNFLPVNYTDFVFATAGEELGFVGSVALLACECFVLWQGVNVASKARDVQGRLLATGVVGMMLTHIVENVGMNLKMLPMTGIPLPFISFGGSFTITALCCIGLLESVAMRRRNLVF